MESLPTIALFASLILLPVATALPNFIGEEKIKNKSVATSIINKDYYCGVVAPTIDELVPLPQIIDIVPATNATSDVYFQLNSYSKLEAGWDGSDSVGPSPIDVKLAIDFVKSIPAIFPLPKTMLSRDGEIGLYWDDNLVYLDIQFEPDKALSVFSRDRLTGKEKFLDSVDVASINSSWYFDALGALLSPLGYALAA